MLPLDRMKSQMVGGKGLTGDSGQPDTTASEPVRLPSASINDSSHKLSDQLKKEILKNISLTGSASDSSSVIIASEKNLDLIIDRTKGIAKIKSSKIKKFNLIVGQPGRLEALNPFEIRCCLCRQVISYPCFYHKEEFTKRIIHFFVCFSGSETVNCKCFKGV